MAVDVPNITPASLKAKEVATESYVDTEIGNIDTSYSALSGKDTLAQELGYTNYAALQAAAVGGSTVINGGYLNTALVEAEGITAGMIDTRGLSIKDNSGNVLFSSGVDIDWSRVDGVGRPADNADVTSSNTAAGIANQGNFATLNQITSGNIATYIAGAAIGNAYIGDAAITNAKIGDAAINSAKIADLSIKTGDIDFQQITIPASSFTAAQTGSSGYAWKDAASITITSTGSPVDIYAQVETNGIPFGGFYYIRILSNGSEVHKVTHSSGVCVLGYRHTPGSGSRTFKIQVWQESSNAGSFKNRYIRVMEVKR